MIGHFILLSALVAAAAAAASAATPGSSSEALPASGEPKHMTVWTFVNRVLREVMPAESSPVLDQFETAFRIVTVELDKNQNYQFNKGSGVIEQLMPNKNGTSSMRETGEIFQDWLERTFDVAYEWAHNNDSEAYRALATEFKAGRDWIRGLSQFNRFTEQHVQVVTDFYRAYSARPDWGAKSPATMYKDFKTHIALEAAGEAGVNGASAGRVRRSALMSSLLEDDPNFRGVFSDPRNETGVLGWLYTFMDYFEDAVVIYNRAQLTLWQPKMLISFIAPPIKFIWSAVDFGYCLHEEIYELAFAQQTEERWWDLLLCSMEVLGVIPGGGAIKFGLRILIRMLKFQLGIHTVPWYLSTPWQYISNWWNGDSGAATQAIEILTSSTVFPTIVSNIIKVVATTPRPTSRITSEYDFGTKATTKAAAYIMGSMSG